MTTHSSNDNLLLNDNEFREGVAVQEQSSVLSTFDSILEQDSTINEPNTTNNTSHQHNNEAYIDTLRPFIRSSRVIIAAAKYPDYSTLLNYGDLQMWMYINANNYSPIDICQSLHRMFLLNCSDDIDDQRLLNLQLICAEAYQTIGDVDQAFNIYKEAEMRAKQLDDTQAALNSSSLAERDRQRKKMNDIEMKLEFQSELIFNLIKRQKRKITNSASCDFLNQLNMNNPSSEQCRFIWRQIVLQFVLNSNLALPGAQWLYSYALRIPRYNLQHANSLYVAFNLFLFHFKSKILEKPFNLDAFKILDDIACLFEQYGNQSKQFSSKHKMAHVWGTAAVVFHLTSDRYKYLVCASMMRATFESLGIRFLSSGIESLYVLARECAHEFFTMMTTDPNVKIVVPECINYFRRELKNTTACIKYSNHTVNQYVLHLFNIDQTNNQI